MEWEVVWSETTFQVTLENSPFSPRCHSSMSGLLAKSEVSAPDICYKNLSEQHASWLEKVLVSLWQVLLICLGDGLEQLVWGQCSVLRSGSFRLAESYPIPKAVSEVLCIQEVQSRLWERNWIFLIWGIELGHRSEETEKRLSTWTPKGVCLLLHFR